LHRRSASGSETDLTESHRRTLTTLRQKILTEGNEGNEVKI
jgi:hypothetical protein